MNDGDDLVAQFHKYLEQGVPPDSEREEWLEIETAKAMFIQLMAHYRGRIYDAEAAGKEDPEAHALFEEVFRASRYLTTEERDAAVAKYQPIVRKLNGL